MVHAVRAALAAALVTVAMSTGCGSDSNLHGMTAPTGPVNCDGKPDLTAEGSTAQQNAIALFNMDWSQLCPGKQLAYNPTGSGAGREQFIARHVDFAGSDSPLSRDQIDSAAQRCNGNPAWHLPIVFGPIAIVFHLDGVSRLVVNADVLAKIFSGSDYFLGRSGPRQTQSRHVAAQHQDLADLPVGLIGDHRQLPEVSGRGRPEQLDARRGSEFQGGVGEGAQKSAGIIEAVHSASGAIGYVEKGFADQSGVPYAQINDGSGAVALTDDAARKAIDDATFAGVGNDLQLDLELDLPHPRRGRLPAGAGHLRDRLLPGLRPGNQRRGQITADRGRRQRARRPVDRRLHPAAGEVQEAPAHGDQRDPVTERITLWPESSQLMGRQ